MSKKKMSAIDNFLKDTNNGKTGLLRWVEFHPHSTIIIIFTIIGFFYRLIKGMTATGILHPDEIYQSLEMSHLLVYDTGYRPSEFENTNEYFPNYASSRSWTFPLIFAIIMYFGELFGLDYHTQILPLIRLVLVINSTFLILAVSKLSEHLTKNKNVGVISAILISIWFRIVEYTVRPFNNTFFLPIFFYSIYRILHVIENKKISVFDHMVIILGLGISTYNRLDLFIIIFGFFFVTFARQNLKYYYEFLVDILAGWGIGIFIDFLFYNKLILVPLRWFKFNIIERNSDLFLLTPSNYYVKELIINDGLKLSYYLILLIGTVVYLIKMNKLNLVIPKDVKILIDGYFRIFTILLFTWLTYSNVLRDITLKDIFYLIIKLKGYQAYSHKEIRFMMGGLILLIMALSVAIELLLELSFVFIYQEDIKKDKTYSLPISSIELKYWSKMLITSVFIALLIFQSINYSDFRYNDEAFADVNEALVYIGHRQDINGLIIISAWYQTGGYTYSHLNNSVRIDFVDFLDNNQYSSIILLENLLKTGNYNYLLLPGYQLRTNSDILIQLIQYNWTINKVFDGRTNVWISTNYSMSTSNV